MKKQGKYVLKYILFALAFTASVVGLVLIACLVGKSTASAGGSIRNGVAVYESGCPTVIIDAGHGGEDGGAVGKGGVLEKDLNLAIAETLYDMLKSDGVNVVMTRTEDIMLYDRNVNYKGRKKMLDLLARLKVAEETENAIFVSIHMNSFPQEKYSGLQVYYSKNDETSKALAESIQSFAKTYIQPDNERGIKAASDNIYILDHISCPAVLIECGFISNSDECRRLSDEKYRQKLALIFFTAIKGYISDDS